MAMFVPHALLHAALLTTAFAGPALAQCTSQWLPSGGNPGVYGYVHASTAWDPDGPGPATSVPVIAGRFSAVDAIPANNIAMYDPATGVWSPLGTGIEGPYYTVVYALTTSANGDLIAAGRFDLAGGNSVNHIARWNGTAWSPVGNGIGLRDAEPAARADPPDRPAWLRSARDG